MIADIASGLVEWWAPGLAFAAGVVSFASPCVLPLVPGYVSFVGGERASEDVAPRRPIVPVLLFIGGFTLVFVLLFLFTANTVIDGVRLLRGDVGRWVSAGIVIAVGMLMIAYALGRGPLSLFAERRPLLARVRPGPRWAFPLGMAFAAGWTPCIGPTLAGILAVAGAQGSVTRGALLLVCYSLGLGLPFLIVGLGVGRMMGAFEWVKRRYTVISAVSGALLVGIGILIGTGVLTAWFARLSPQFEPII
jgi:cytochrome c-type biogenesis protein